MIFGDIVLLQFPYSDTQSVKRCPALVIFNSQDADILVCRITSQAYQSEMDVEVQNWKTVGLLLPSTIRVHKMACIEKVPVEKTIGHLDSMHKEKVRDAFQFLLQNLNT